MFTTANREKNYTGNLVTFWTDGNAKQTDRMFSGRISEGIKVGERYGKPEYEFESWSARFVGNALEKARELSDKSTIRLTEWSAHNPYSKEHKRSYPYILVTDFELVVKDEAKEEEEEEDGDLPF